MIFRDLAILCFRWRQPGDRLPGLAWAWWWRVWWTRRQRRWRMGSSAAAASWLGQRARRAPRVGSPHEMAWAGVFRGGGFAWGDGAADCSCTIRGDVAWGYRPPEEAAAGEENTLAAPSRQRRGSRRPRPSTERRSPSPGRDAGVEEGAAAVPLEAARWGPSPSWTEQRRRSKGLRPLHSR